MTSSTNNTERSVAEVGEDETTVRLLISEWERAREQLNVRLDRRKAFVESWAKRISRRRTEAEARVGEVEALARAAFREGIWAGWHSGMAGEQMDYDYAEKSWSASDVSHQLPLAALKPTEPSEAKVERMFAVLWPLQEWEGDELVCRAAARAALAAAEGQATLTDSQGSGSVRG